MSPFTRAGGAHALHSGKVEGQSGTVEALPLRRAFNACHLLWTVWLKEKSGHACPHHTTKRRSCI
eukprot:6218082-Amphidinium_carterae.4